MANLSQSLEKQAVYTAELPIHDDESEALAQDEKDMARMGKKQEFKRNFNWVSGVGFTSCTMDECIIPSPYVFDTNL